MPSDDLVIRYFADESVELRERNNALEDEKAWLMDCLKECLAHLNRSTVQMARFQARVINLVELVRSAQQENAVLRAELRLRSEEAPR